MAFEIDKEDEDFELSQILLDVIHWFHHNTIKNHYNYTCLTCMKLCIYLKNNLHSKDTSGALICPHCNCNYVVNCYIDSMYLIYINKVLFPDIDADTYSEVCDYEMEMDNNTVHNTVVMARLNLDTNSYNFCTLNNIIIYTIILFNVQKKN